MFYSTVNDDDVWYWEDHIDVDVYRDEIERKMLIFLPAKHSVWNNP